MNKVCGIALQATVVLLLSFASSCGNSSKPKIEEQFLRDSITKAVKDSIERANALKKETDSFEEQQFAVSLIDEFYQYVFDKEEMRDKVLDRYLSAKVKQSLWSDDLDCYEYWRFRTAAQDSNGDYGDISRVAQINPLGDGWYAVSYFDMGWQGETRIRIRYGKIIDFKADKTWDNN